MSIFLANWWQSDLWHTHMSCKEAALWRQLHSKGKNVGARGPGAKKSPENHFPHRFSMQGLKFLRARLCHLCILSISLRSVPGASQCVQLAPVAVVAAQVWVWPKHLQTYPSRVQRAWPPQSSRHPWPPHESVLETLHLSDHPRFLPLSTIVWHDW